MPNWCNNVLTITGSKNRLDEVEVALAQPYATFYSNLNFNTGDIEIQEGTAEGPLLFWNMRKPEDVDAFWEVPDGNGNRDVLGWATRNWGTKWELGTDTIFEKQDGELRYVFSTAWAPPLGALAAFAGSNPDLSITVTFDEPGMDFAGIIDWENGEITREVEQRSRTQFCEVCDTTFFLDWGEEDATCTYWVASEGGSVLDRMHRVVNGKATAEELNEYARVDAPDTDDEDRVALQTAIVRNPVASSDTCVYIAANATDDEVIELAVRRLTRADIDALADSPDPAMQAFASKAIVLLSGM